MAVVACRPTPSAAQPRDAAGSGAPRAASGGGGAKVQGVRGGRGSAPVRDDDKGGEGGERKPLKMAEARKFALRLINRDRATQGLPPVVLDEGAPTEAAMRHVRDMTKHGFTGHWGSDGSVPELRYTEAGGDDIVQENAACLADGKDRPINDKGPFDPAEIERFEAAFFNEKPPHDGHRKNILNALHNRVGIGFAQAEGTSTVCVVQEFVDDYGSYDALVKRAKAGQVVRVAGEMKGPASFGGIGLARTDLPKPRKPDLRPISYAMPSPFVSYFPAGYKTPAPVHVNGNKFWFDLPVTDKGPGLYEVQIFARLPGKGNRLEPVSMRTVRVEQ
jgi:uncharacterized protein YkwD